MEHVYWNPTMETMPREQLRALQDERLRDVVRRVYEHVPFYRNKMQQLGITPNDIHGVEDLHLLPFTEKKDLRNNYPFGLFAVPQSEIVRIHASSGTTGKPSVAGYTSGDIDRWAELMARAMYCANVGKNDIVQVAYGYGLFTGGLGAHYGAERVGASVIPMSGGNTVRQLMLMEDFGSTALCCTPSYALNLADAMEREGITLDRIRLKSGIFGAEPCSENMRQEIADKLGIQYCDVYGLSEIMGPGVAMECAERGGLHIAEDQFYCEIIDPETLEVLPDGEVGELVITTLTRECSPMIRYRTRDVTTINAEPCACGRTHRKIGRLLGRTDDMLIIRGVNVFPSQIEQVITEFPEIATQYQIILTMNGPLDHVELQVETEPDFPIDEVRRLEDLRNRLAAALKSNLQVAVDIKFVEPKTIARSEGKAKRVIDLRGENQ